MWCIASDGEPLLLVWMRDAIPYCWSYKYHPSLCALVCRSERDVESCDNKELGLAPPPIYPLATAVTLLTEILLIGLHLARGGCARVQQQQCRMATYPMFHPIAGEIPISDPHVYERLFEAVCRVVARVFLSFPFPSASPPNPPAGLRVCRSGLGMAFSFLPPTVSVRGSYLLHRW